MQPGRAVAARRVRRYQGRQVGRQLLDQQQALMMTLSTPSTDLSGRLALVSSRGWIQVGAAVWNLHILTKKIFDRVS